MRIERPAGRAVVAAVALSSILITSPVAAAEASLRIEPSSVAVANGATFAVKVVQEAPVATSGAQASVEFDPKILQVVSVSPGAAYRTAPIFLPQDIEADIRTANRTGHLAQVAVAHTPPDAVPPGVASFLVVRFRVAGCGQTDIVLPTGGPFNAQMISGQADGYGFEVSVATARGHVTTCASPDAVTPDALTTDPSGPATSGIVGSGSPTGLIVAAGTVGVALLSALAWRLRWRRQDPTA